MSPDPKGVIKLTIEQQTAIRTDLGAVEFKPYARVKIQPKIALRTRTHWVCHFADVQHQITC